MSTREPMEILLRPDRASFAIASAGGTKPVLVRGLTDDWPARSRWSADYLREAFGQVQVRTYRGGAYDAPQLCTLAQYLIHLDDASDPDPSYLSNWEFEHDCPALLNDYGSPPIFDRLEGGLPPQLRPRWRWMFIGPAGSHTPLHVDVLQSSAWNAVITGRKRWVFYPPGQTAFLYGGRVDCFAPDLVAFPLFAQAHAIECVQEPGDLVFTPSGWWHQVRNEAGGISITENFIDLANLEKVAAAARLAGIPGVDQALRALRLNVAGHPA